jgi:hypothetical protein
MEEQRSTALKNREYLGEKKLPSGIFRRVVSYKLADVSEVFTASIIILLMIVSASTFEKSVTFYDTT